MVMKRILMALSAVAGMAAAGGSARADWGGFTPPTGPQGAPVPMATQGEFTTPGTLMGLGAPTAGKAPDRYGLLPALRKPFKLDGGCSTCNKCGPFANKGMGHGGGYMAPQYPPVQQGTLVFPNHPYVRSPRDFFMYEPAR
jgi:hypothetical protein